jgi:ATP/maltotriose-dependent transcriptional regulator MalT
MAIGDAEDAFVARGAELDVMRSALSEARAGRPAIVAVEGEPGIGKTRLLRRFLAEEPDVEVLWASGDEAETSLEHGIVSQLWAATPADLRLDAPVPPDGAAGSDGFAAGAALLGALGALQERGTVAMVVDDLQWADLASARALLFALRRLQGDHVLVLLASRTDSLGRLGGSWQRLLTEPARRLRLPGLTPPDLRPLAMALCGLDLPSAVRERLCEHTAGNPLYIRTLLAELPASALADASGPLPAPHSYSATVITRAARLSGTAQDLLRAGSVIGLRFSLRTAAMAAGIEDALAVFDDACAAGLLTAMRVGTEEAAFPHPLVRAAIYDDLSVARRRHLHRAVSRLVTGPEALAHRVAAAQGADDELATELATIAESSITAGELPKAAQDLFTAARLGADRALSEDRLLRAVELLLIAGDASAHSHVETVRACRDGLHKRFVLSVLTAATGQLGEATAQLESLVQDTRLSGDAVLFGRAAGALALFCSMHGRGPEAMAWATKALETAGDDPTMDLTARQVLASALAIEGRAPEALALLASLSPAKISPAPFEPELLATRGSLKASAGDFAGAVQDLAAVVRWSRSGAPLRSLPDAYAALAQAEFGRGTWNDAATHAELAVSLARDLGHPWFLAQAHKVAVDIYSARGDWQFAKQHLERAYQAADEMDVPGEMAAACVAGATLAWAQGAWEVVIEALVPLHQDDLGLLTANFDPVTWRLREAEALLGTGRVDQAAWVLDKVQTAPTCPPAAALALHRLRAGLALAWDRPGEAQASFTAGLDIAARASAPLEHGLVVLAYGRFLRADGNRREAIRSLRAAQEILSGLGAAPFLRVCEAELSACGVRVSGSPAQPNPHGLTAKEQVIAGLVAQGLTNREVAAELYVSAKAIEYHLGNIYAKVGVSSRRQLGPRLSIPGTRVQLPCG